MFRDVPTCGSHSWQCRVGGVSSAKAIIKGLKETGFSTNNSLQDSENRRGWPIAKVTIME